MWWHKVEIGNDDDEDEGECLELGKKSIKIKNVNKVILVNFVYSKKYIYKKW